VDRYPTGRDWKGGIEEVDPDGRIIRGLGRNSALEYLVVVKVESEKVVARYFVTGCGDFLMKREFAKSGDSQTRFNSGD
jgi:hypothetical protein